MLQESDIAGLARQVLWAAFGLSVVFGAIAQRTQFCTMGAVTDVLQIGDTTRLRMWVLAMAVAALGFNGMVALGWLNAADTVYAQPRVLWLSNLLGGLLFGFGMVLASGCGSKTLVRVGGGSLKSLVVFVVLAVASYATLRGMVAVARVATVEQVFITLPVGQDLPSLAAHATGVPRTLAAGLLGLLLAGAALVWVLCRPQGRTQEVWLAGLGLGAVVAAVWWVSGVLGFVAEHPATLERTFLATNTRRLESLTFVAPIAYTVDWFILFSDSSKVLTLGIASVLGVVVGAAVSAVLSGTFRWEGFADTADTARHLVGAVCMGVGGVTAMGCTVGQGLSGVSTLSVGSFIALAGILAGAALGLKAQMWMLERSL